MNNRICYFKSISIIIFSFFFLNTAAHENKVIISSEISGPQNVCTGFPYIYGIEEEESGFIYVWEVEGGKTLGNNTGQQVTRSEERRVGKSIDLGRRRQMKK